MLTVNGLVISERTVGEQDKFISVLTADHGTLEVSVKGANKITGRNHAAVQLFAYSKLCLSAKGDRYYLNSSELIRDFYDLRLDIKKLALACYIGEAAGYSVPDEKQRESGVMRLVLNCLHMLDTGKRSCEFVKSVFELRFMSEIGMMPQLIGCRVCYTYEAEEMYFLIDRAYVLCADDFGAQGLSENGYNVKITPSQLSALQFICLSEHEKLFNFRLSEESQAKLSEITEKYILCRLGRTFRSLEYYHSV